PSERLKASAAAPTMTATTDSRRRTTKASNARPRVVALPRQRQPEHAPAARIGLDPDAHPPGDREPQAGAPVVGAPVHAREHLEHPLCVARVDADAVVGHRELAVAVGLASADQYLRLPGRGPGLCRRCP